MKPPIVPKVGFEGDTRNFDDYPETDWRKVPPVSDREIRDGNLWVAAIVKSCVNRQAGSWLAAQEWTTNQKPGQQVDTTLDNDYNL